MSKWQQVTLREVCDVVQYGFTASASKEEIGPKFLRITDIVPERLDWAAVPHCEIEASKQAKYVLHKGDIVIARTGATTGYAKWIKDPPEAIFASYLVRIRANERADSRFIGFVAESNDYKYFIQQNIGGSAQPNANAQVLTSYPLNLPPLETQRQIASVLSAYDDLIENNARRIKVLEEMAGLIYREWFVNFRFPGHEGVRRVASELGEIPEDWGVVSFTDIADVLGGGTPQTTNPDYWNGNISFFTPKDAPDSFYVLSTEKTITEEGFKNSSTKIYSPDTVFVTARGTVGKVAMPAAEMAMNQSCYALKGKNGTSQYYLLLALKNQVEYLKQNAHGAVFSTIITDTFKRMRVIYPSRDVRHTFSKLAAPMFAQVLSLLKKNQNLRRTRDLLLPKLISGELEVSQLGEAHPETAQVA